MNTEDTVIKINITHKLKDDKRYSSVRDAFWVPLLNYNVPEDRRETKIEAVSDHIESLIIDEMGRNLSSEFSRYIIPELASIEYTLLGEYYDKIKPEKFANLRLEFIREFPVYKNLFDKKLNASQVSFRFEVLSYSSLEISLFIGALTKAVDLFGSNFDLFKNFVEIYLPVSCVRTLKDYPKKGWRFSIDDEEYIKQMEFDFEYPKSIKNMFISSNGKSNPEKIDISMKKYKRDNANKVETKDSEKAEFIWKIVNSTLLIPVILSLIVLYFAYDNMSKTRDAQIKALNPIIEYQNDFIEYQLKNSKEITERFKFLEQKLIEKALRSEERKGSVSNFKKGESNQ